MDPFRTTSRVVLNKVPASQFLEKLEQQAATQWRDFSAGHSKVHTVSSTYSADEVARAVEEGALLVVEEGVELDTSGLELVKEGFLPKVEKENENVRRVSMSRVSAWMKK